MSERIIITIQLPVSITALVAILRVVECIPCDPKHTFTRQVGERLEIYERLPDEKGDS